MKNWANDPRIKNTMLKNFQKKFQKPMGIDIYEYSVQLDLLMDYIDLLPSTTIKQKIADKD